MKRFGILGDVHAEHEALSVALSFLRAQEVDAILAVGDIADGQGSLTATCRLLAEAGVLTVRGNHDRWLLEGTMRGLAGATPARDVDDEARAFLAALPATRRIPTVRGELLLCHGTGDDDMVTVSQDDSGYALETNDALQGLLRDASVRWMVCGHSHRRLVRRIGTLTIINAGTLRRDHDPCVGIVDLGTAPTATFFERIPSGALALADVIALSAE